MGHWRKAKPSSITWKGLGRATLWVLGWITLGIVAGYMITGCASLQTALNTPEKRSAFFMGYYLNQRQSYEYGVEKMGSLEPGAQRDALKEVLKVKKRFLEEFGPAVEMYDQTIQRGQVPTVELETAIWKMYDRLQEDLR